MNCLLRFQKKYLSSFAVLEKCTSLIRSAALACPEIPGKTATCGGSMAILGTPKVSFKTSSCSVNPAIASYVSENFSDRFEPCSAVISWGKCPFSSADLELIFLIIISSSTPADNISISKTLPNIGFSSNSLKIHSAEPTSTQNTYTDMEVCGKITVTRASLLATPVKHLKDHPG